MSSRLVGDYRFLPWARRGLGAAIADGPPGSTDGRAKLDVTLHVTTEGGPRPAEKLEVSLPFYGPGDVTGIDTRQVIRTDPAPNTGEFEPNYLVSIEFDSPYLPWLFSPDRSSSRMRPWLCLVVLERENATLTADPGRPVPTVSIPAARGPFELPDLSEAWAWAHVQVTGGDSELQTALEGKPEDNRANPERNLSRLICPRRLAGRKSYLACLVPAFAVGRETGLGIEVTTTDEPATMDEPAWPPTPGGWPESGQFELPVYYSWEFTTSPGGDFEALVRRLHARPLDPAEVGTRAMDLTTAGAGLPVPAPGSAGSALGFEGALGVPLQPPTPWPAEARDAFQAELRKRLAEALDVNLTVLTPPVYGHAQAGRTPSVPDPGQPPHWLRRLNLDPRYRGAAALGARVIQELQEQLVAAAWDQAGQLEHANRLLRHAQMARGTAAAVHENRLRPLAQETSDALLRTSDALLRLTGPVHRRVRVEPDGSEPTDPSRRNTLRGSMRASVFPRAAVSAPFRRVVRPAGPVARWVPKGATHATRRLTRSLAKGEVEVPIKRAHGAVEFDAVERGQGRKLGHVSDRLDTARGWNKISGPATAEDVPFYPEPASPAGGPGEVARALRASAGPRVATDLVSPPRAPADGRPTGGSLWEPGEGTTRRNRRLVGINKRFHDAAAALHAYLDETRPIRPTPGPELALDAVATTLADTTGPLHPERTVPELLRARVPDPPEGTADPLTPRPAVLRFAQPMWDPLRRLSQEFLLPGADSIKPDTITLLGGNARFIEAYMIGLSHELSRELLWRGMPADYGATYFRQFWDVRGRGPGGGVTPTEDIPDVTDWDEHRDLGENATAVGGGGMLVLLLRGELLRRYPTTAIYAVRGEWLEPEDGDAPRRRVPGTVEMYPEFRGNLEPDIVFLGFPLAVWEARGSSTDPGWYFVLQEQPTAPRFGFDELRPEGDPDRFGARPSSWSDLSWGHLVRTEADYATLTHAQVTGPKVNPKLLTPPIPNATWGADSAHMAAITLQQPVRIAVHAALMLGDVADTAEEVTTASHDSGVVTAIGGRTGRGEPWQLTAAEAIDALQRAARGFYVEIDGERYKVTTLGPPGERRLVAPAADGSNLLLDLPEV